MHKFRKWHWEGDDGFNSSIFLGQSQALWLHVVLYGEQDALKTLHFCVSHWNHHSGESSSGRTSDLLVLRRHIFTSCNLNPPPVGQCRFNNEFRSG